MLLLLLLSSVKVACETKLVNHERTVTFERSLGSAFIRATFVTQCYLFKSGSQGRGARNLFKTREGVQPVLEAS